MVITIVFPRLAAPAVTYDSITMIPPSNSYVRIDMTYTEIENKIDKIHEKLYDFMRDTGKSSSDVTLIINEIDFKFIEMYLRQSFPVQNIIGAQPNVLFGMKVKKMKAQGFIFAYE